MRLQNRACVVLSPHVTPLSPTRLEFGAGCRGSDPGADGKIGPLLRKDDPTDPPPPPTLTAGAITGVDRNKGSTHSPGSGGGGSGGEHRGLRLPRRVRRFEPALKVPPLPQAWV